MLIVEDCIISDNLAEVKFCCDLAECRGACCVEGDSGAPLDSDEIPVLESLFPTVRQYMSDGGIRAVAEYGTSVVDSDGQPCTPLVEGRECAYAVVEDAVTLCAIEKAWRDGKTDFRKPVSCHLYPVRIEDYGEFKAVNYHEWEICRCAVRKGRRDGEPLYRYLEEPLVRRFGQEWYDELCRQCESRR